MARILIIDDEEYIRDILKTRLERMGHIAHSAPTLGQGLAELNRALFDLVFLDVNLPDGSGLSALPAIKENPHKPEVVIITADGSSKGAELAIKNGAWDYIEKPFTKETIILHLKRALEFREAKQNKPIPVMLDVDSIIGKSSSLKECLRQVAQCARSLVNVIIYGETGTGKELFAKAIHDNCTETSNKFIVVDCAAMPEHLIESLLFGHKKGAFTGADKDSRGLILNAHRGTLFLDEIGELPLSMQKAFLRVLQEKKFRPVGSTEEIKSRFRLICATNRNLDVMVEQGKFRKDLLHRLKTFVIDLPPLRNRPEDIKELSFYYMDKLCKKHGISQKLIPPDTLSILKNYDWPGNIRELINAIEKAILSEPDIPLLYSALLPAHIRIAHAKNNLKVTKNNLPQGLFPPMISMLYDDGIKDKMPLFKTFKNNAFERIVPFYFKNLLAKTNWNLDKAAGLSGLSKNRIYFFIRKYKIKQDNLF